MRHLRSIFDLALGTLVVSTSACSGKISRDGFDQNVCDAGKVKLEGLSSSPAHDYVAYRASSYEDTEPDTVISEYGTKCSTASDKEACVTALSNLHPKAGINRGFDGRPNYLVATSGSNILAVTKKEELVTWLGATIESPQDAAWVAIFNGYFINCADTAGGNNAKVVSGGFELIVRKGESCGGPGVYEIRLFVKADGTTEELESNLVIPGEPNCAIGRRPSGLTSVVPCHADPIAMFFANAYHLEAASVPAFLELGAQLRALGAPRAMVTRCHKAAKEEAKHAKLMAKWARQVGAATVAPRLSNGSKEGVSVFILALQNAVEGCVRETFGALEALHQSRHAATPELRALFAEIASDEMSHSELAWDIHDWAFNQMDEGGQEAVRMAMSKAVRELCASVPGTEAVRQLGVPDVKDRSRLLGALHGYLWTEAAAA